MSSRRGALGPHADCLRPQVPPRPAFRLDASSACCRGGRGCPCTDILLPVAAERWRKDLPDPDYVGRYFDLGRMNQRQIVGALCAGPGGSGLSR